MNSGAEFVLVLNLCIFVAAFTCKCFDKGTKLKHVNQRSCATNATFVCISQKHTIKYYPNHDQFKRVGLTFF